jgi:hypothetical protein
MGMLLKETAVVARRLEIHAATALKSPPLAPAEPLPMNPSDGTLLYVYEPPLAV